MKISKNIKKIRSFRKLSQQAFAESFDLTRASVSAYEDGRANPKMEVLIKIAKKFNIPLEVFLNEELTINQLSHFDANIQRINHQQEDSTFHFNVRFVSESNVKEYLAKRSTEWLKELPVISFPFPINASEIAFTVVPELFTLHLEGVNIGDVLFCHKAKKFDAIERGNYLLIFEESYLVSELLYDTQKKCLVNPSNPIEKIFEDEVVGVFKINALLSNSISTIETDESKEVRKTLRKLDKYLKL